MINWKETWSNPTTITHKEIQELIDQTREETIRAVEEIVNKIIIKDYSKKWGDNVVDFAKDIVNRTILLIKEQLNKLKK